MCKKKKNTPPQNSFESKKPLSDNDAFKALEITELNLARAKAENEIAKAKCLEIIQESDPFKITKQ